MRTSTEIELRIQRGVTTKSGTTLLYKGIYNRLRRESVVPGYGTEVMELGDVGVGHPSP